jgi:Ca2+/H+ antiporter
MSAWTWLIPAIAIALLVAAGVAWASFALLLVSLVVVVGLAKMLSPTIELVVEAAGAPGAVPGFSFPYAGAVACLALTRL